MYVKMKLSVVSEADEHAQVSIRAFLPLWVFLYVLQFLFMPLIARDYWVSNFFGNTMYLLALSYYFVITFLGYNGAQNPKSSLLRLQEAASLIETSSIAISESHRGPSGASSCPGNYLVHQFVHI